MRLVLSADLKSIVVNEGYQPEDLAAETQRIKGSFVAGKITPRTNHGVRLGMSRQSVQRILGKPHKSFWSKKFAAQEIVYSRQTRKSREGMSLKFTNYYLFKGGKLYFIELSRDFLGGG